MNIIISIVIPVFNTGEYLRDTLRSVFEQSYKNIEVIVVDDCSKDNSCEIVDEFCKIYENCKLIKLETNGGQSKARNIGINHSTGDFIYFMDSDDILPNDSIAVLIAAIEDDVDYIVGDVVTLGIENSKIYSLACSSPQTFNGNKQVVKIYSYGAWNVAPWAKLYRKSFLHANKIKFKEGIILEDELWSMTCAYHANKVKVIPDIVYEYYIRNNSTMNQVFSEKHLNGLCGDIEGMKEVFADKYKSPLVECIIVLAFRLAEVVIKGDYDNDLRNRYISFLSKEITLPIIIGSIGYSIKKTIKAVMFLLPSNLWGLYLKLLNRQ